MKDNGKLMEFRADLHSHSYFSDGVLSPEDILLLAKKNNLNGISITDHDTISAYSDDLFLFSYKLGIELIVGIEISASFLKNEIHVLGYGIDRKNGEFLKFLEEIKIIRKNRLKKIIEKINKITKKKISFEEFFYDFCPKKFLFADVYLLPHLSLFLLEKGITVSFQDGFEKYLKEGSECLNIGDNFWPSVEDAAKKIRAATGRVVLAHPCRIKSRTILNKLLASKKIFDGIEVYYGSSSFEDEAKFLHIANERGFIISSGSDFHSESSSKRSFLGSKWCNRETFEKLEGNEIFETIFFQTRKNNKSLYLMRELAKLFQNPQNNFLSIHIAGTNGKGSVATKIAKALQCEGYRVGLYTSPHITSFCERIVINGVPIDESVAKNMLRSILNCIKESKICESSEIVNSTEPIKPLIENILATNFETLTETKTEGLKLTNIETKLEVKRETTLEKFSFFEIITLLAFIYFSEQRVDFAVIETGLGGKFDATNIISPILSIITSISFDHMHILGDTLDEIAQEKSGIIKKGVPVVLGPFAKFKPILEQAKLLGSYIILTPKDLAPKDIEKDKNAVEKSNVENKFLKNCLFFDSENSDIAKNALLELQKRYKISDNSIEEGIKIKPRCRFEIFKKYGVEIVFDVAHNEDGFFRLFSELSLRYKKVRTLLGFCNDKDIKRCLSIAAKNSIFLHLVSVNNKRSASLESMVEILENGLKICNFSYGEIDQEVKLAFEEAKKNNETLVVCGSFYIMEPVFKLLEICH